MGPAGRQLGALLWKNWLCRLRNPVLFLAEFFWPCILFTILTVLRFQEPPRHRDNCYLQPRDLPSRGVFPFVRGLLCNTGANCRNRSSAESTEHHFRSSAFQASAGHHKAIDDLVFLQDMQDLATEVCEVMDKAANLKKLWVEGSKTPGSQGFSFLTIDLNKTEEVISKLESLHQQPHIWDFLLLLPRLFSNAIHADDGLRGGVHLLQAVLKVLNSTKELLKMEKKFHILEDEKMNFLVSFVEFLEKLLLPNLFNSPSGPTETVLNTSHVWVNHLKGLEREPSGIDTQKLWEFGKEMTEKIKTLEKESSYILRLIEAILFEINPKLLESWMYSIPKGDRAKLETLSALLNFSVLGNERILSKSFNFSQLFHLDWPKSAAAKMDFVHLSETILNSLYEFGFLGPEQVSEALGTVYAVRNASDLFSALSEPPKQEVDKILTHLYLNVFKDKDTTFLLQLYSSFYQYIYKFWGIQSRESFLSSLTQTSKHILDIIKQFNFQNISRAFTFLYETTEFLGGISELSYCQQLLSVFNFLELQAHFLVSTEGPAWETTHATLIGLKQLFMEDEDFRVSLFQYVNQLLEGSVGTLLGSECFARDNKSTPPMNHSADGGSPLTLPWVQVLSNLSTPDGMFSELKALHCFISWLQMWAEIWASMAQVLQWDTNVFTPLHVGLSQLLDELESDVKISETCRGLFPTQRPVRLMLHLLKNLSRVGGFGDWDGFLTLRHPWAALHGALVRVKSLPLDQVERSLFTVETALRQLVAFPLNTSATREFFSSLLRVFMELSNTSEPRDRHVHLIDHFLSNNLTDYELHLESIITDLRETILFLRNVSHDQDLLSCADIFQNLTEFILEDGLLHVNTSQRTLLILALLNSSFYSEDTLSRLKGCIKWVDSINCVHGTANPSASQDHLQAVLRSFRDMENKINSTLTLITWLLNTVEPGCSLNTSNINCVNIYLKNITDFLHVILTAVFEKEKVPKFEMLLTLLNDSTNQVRMIISNLTRDFEFASLPTWKRFIEIILRPIEMSDEIPSQFQNIWLHLVALGKEIQELVRDIFPSILENNLSSKAEMFLSIFTTSPKEKDISHVGHSLFHLASYLAFNLSHDLQNSPKIIPREIRKAVSLGIQLIRDMFNSLMPSIPHNIPEDPVSYKVLKKVSSFLLALKKTDIDLLVDQLEEVGESLMDFLKNISRPDTDNLGVNLLVGLMEKLVDSSHAWNVNHLLRLSRLFPREDVDVVVGLYYALPHAARLLQRVLDHNVTEILQDVYDFTVLHGTSISNVTKEDFTDVLKTLLDTTALVSDKPSILAEGLTCLPVVWCWNHTTSGFQQNPKLEACHGQFYSKVASILDSLHLSPPGDISQCSNESTRTEVTRKIVCTIHGLVDWTSILLELSEIFHVKTHVLKHVRTVQGVWQKVLPFVPSSGNQSNGSIFGLCPSGPVKQVALQIIETLKNVNFTKVTSDGNILDKLATLNKILNSEGTEASLRNISFYLERMIKSLSGDQSLGNNAHSLDSLLMNFLNANLIGRNLKALSSFLKKHEAAYNFEDLWLKSEQTMKDLNHELNSRTLFPEINKEIQTINSVALLNVTLQLAHFLGNLNSSQALEITEDFPSVLKIWLHKYANEEYFRMIQTLFLLTANGSSLDDTTLLTAGIITFLDYLSNISREGNFDVGLLTQLVHQEQPSNVSVVQSLLESFLINSVSNLAASPPEATWSLSGSDLHIVDLLNLTLTPTKSGKGERVTLPPGSTVEFMEQLLETFVPLLGKENPENKVSVLLRGFRGDAAAEVSAAGLCEDSQPTTQPPAAAATLRRVKMLVLHALLMLAEHQSVAEDLLCAALTRRPGWLPRLVAAALQAATVLRDLYQELGETWSSPRVLSCEGLNRNLSLAMEHLRSSLLHASAQGCACASAPDWAPQHLFRLAQRLKETLFSGTSIMAFLSNFTVIADVKVRDLMRNVTEVTEALRSIHISDETIRSVLEANISRSQVLLGALEVALSGRCNEDTLHLLLAFPEGEQSALAVKELCGLSGATVYSLLVSLGRHLDLRGFIYKMLIPVEASRVLRSLLDVVSRLSHLLPRASYVLEHLPEFLHSSKITALLDVSDFQQVPLSDEARSSAFGNFQAVMKMVCKEEASFLSSSHLFLHLPRVNELLGDDKEKFNIPKDSSPFCLKLYQEILQSPDGALVWSFLKPILHGQILYTPNTPEISKVIRKANYTFLFVDKLRTLSETLLKASGIFQSGGNGQLLGQLQEALRNRFVRSFVGTQLHIDVDQLTERLQTYGGILGRMLSQVGTTRILALGRVLVNLSSCVALNRFQGLESVTVLEAAAQELRQENSFLASVIFNTSLVGSSSGADPPRLPPHVTYTIRTSVLYSMRTNLVKNPFWKFHPQSLPADGFKYNYVFAPLQDMIERAIVLEQTGQEAVGPAVQVQAIPYPCHSSDLFLNNVGFFFPLIMMLAWMVSVASMVRQLVYEREIQLEGYLSMMGVHPGTHFLAWFLENAAVVAVSSAVLAFVLKTSGIFTYSDAFVVFLFLLDFGVSVIMLSYLLSALFRRASMAALCSSLLYVTSFLPYVILLVLRGRLGAAAQTCLCLFSTTAFGQGVFLITFLEGQEAGVQWGNVDQSPEPVGMTFGGVCWVILLDSGLYFLCGWYLSNLIPGTFGVRKPWYFLFTALHWRSVCGVVVQAQRGLCSSWPLPRKDPDPEGSPTPLGKETREEGTLGVTLVSVTKEYQPHQPAVRDLTLTFHREQITALLGTNGAGKTTVLSMLTGLQAPTSGTILVDGRDLRTGLSEVRKEIGVCPQRDVLLDRLTVREHLLLFAAIRSPQWTTGERQWHVDTTLQDVGLVQHQHQQARALSGGLKRKLSIGAAVLGRSRTVILDEPTSGVDPCSRRGIWDILLKYREGRTIVFTTHHLDEAEALSDCVALLQQGRLQGCGPPLCLAQACSPGLRLTLTRQPSIPEVDDPKHTAHATSLVQSYVPQAHLRDSCGRELSYAIPQDADRAGLKGLFQALEQNQHRLHLMGCGLSDPTLEEVFLALLQDSRKQADAAAGAESQSQSLGPMELGPGCYDGTPASTRTQAAALLTQRLCHARRAWSVTLSDLLLPVLFVALAMGLFMVRPLAVDYPPLKMSPGHYEKAETYFFSSGGGSDDMELTRVLLQTFGEEGLLCAGGDPDPKDPSCWRSDPLFRPDAQASCGCLTCPNTSTSAPSLTSRLGHTLLNLSASRLEELLLLPSNQPRLGGWSFGVRAPGPGPEAHSVAATPRSLAKVWYNQKGFHALPSYLNYLNNLLLWGLLPPAEDWRRYGITLYSHPYGGALLNEDRILESVRQCGVALCIALGFSILTASRGSAVVRDRVTGAKRLQHISGLGHGTYWFTNFLFDMLFYSASVCLCVVVILAFGLPAFTFRQNLAATALLLLLFGYATLPWMYLVSRVFPSADVAFISYVSLNFVFGLCTLLMTTMPQLLAIVSRAQNLQDISDMLRWAFTLFPQFCLGQGLVELCYNQIKYDLARGLGIDSYASPFSMSFLGWIFVQLACQGSVLLLLRLLLHGDLLQWSRSQVASIQGTVTSCKDVDVEKEQARVLKGRTGGDLLVLYNLSKSYRGLSRQRTAVHDVSLGLRRGECFGLLGVNGAGKTTTFKMLTGDVTPTAGHAVVRTPAGEDAALFSAQAAGLRIGYCPQQDALDEHLTGWEHLRYYCRLRGLPTSSVQEVAGDLVRRLGLEAHVDQPVATYSGGTKRKLSTALALLGRPDLLLLDEPSSGMDPCSKRLLWEAVRKEVLQGCAVVLTSHSMEECEALCTRLAIMVDGRFRCLGSPQHLKHRFGDGYTVRVWGCQEGGPHAAISACLQRHFPGAQFKGRHLNLLEYHVPKTRAGLAGLLRVLESSKAALSIERYSISQTSLEQVFINFATEQQPTPPATPNPSTASRQPHPLPV
ncbi:ATP-binding cassette sub-family A member 13 isoform X2 [Sturnira hondurensis]|uniref:ATP-binding cassette sub-family A member 13 isoform X2 n=1 Tax=Sturnira hondurensis TaxID=192404 RepID=UPI00187ADBF0|nr:ATP-binding cassette sub-family A member 13 isoform X2 [Sturnira hondurensis]